MLCMNLTAALTSALEQCALHVRVLERDLAALPGRFDPALVESLDDRQRTLLDQAAYRYMKLQDGLGEKVLPALLALTLDPLPPEAPFAQKLQRLERLGAIPSAAGWRLLREVRNSLVHDYPDHPDVQAALLNSFVAAASSLLKNWQQVKAYVDMLASAEGG